MNKTDTEIKTPENCEFPIDLLQQSGKEMTKTERQKLQKLLLEYKKIFAQTESDLGVNNQIRCEIKLDDETPIKVALNRMSVSTNGLLNLNK